MSTVGADIAALRSGSRVFFDAASRLRVQSGSLDRVGASISPRLSASRQRVDAIEAALAGHSAVLHRLAQDLAHEADEQQNVSGGAQGRVGSSLRHVGSGAVPLLRGVPRKAVGRRPLLGGVLRGRLRLGAAGISAAPKSTWPEFARRVHDQSNLGRGLIETGQGISRAYLRSPHGPRTLKGLLRTDIRDLSKTFAMKGVSATTKAKYLKQSKAGGRLVGLGVVASMLSSREGVSRVVGEGGGNALGMASSILDATKLVGLAKLGRPLSKASMTMSRVGGAFAIAGGATGLWDTASRYRAGEISGKIAARDTSINGAMVVGGALMLFPATAPIGAVVVAGAAIAQAGAWVYDNRKQIATYAKSAATVLKNAVANPVAASRAVVRQVEKVLPAPVKKFVANVNAGAAKTLNRFIRRRR